MYLRTTVTAFRKKLKNFLNWYYSVQHLLPSSLLFKDLKIKIYKAII